MEPDRYTFTSESVCEGHPDKVCDFVADSILDAYLEQDPTSRVACEALVKSDTLVLAGEITSNGDVDRDAIARAAIRRIGYADPTEVFNADWVKINQLVTEQSPEIARGVDGTEQGAGDQGQMFGYATNETAELMPLPILLAHRVALGLADDRAAGREDWLRPDGKTQVSVVYDRDTRSPLEVSHVVVSAQHSSDVDLKTVQQYVSERLLPRVLGSWFSDETAVLCNPTGSFVQGGPEVDSGLTGRKNNVDTYGGMARHGGGALSGKDPSKVDRSAAYFCRYVARQLVRQGAASRVEVQVAYAIGVAAPVSLSVETFGTGDPAAAQALAATYDFRPRAMIERLDLLRPIYRRTTNYGHFGRPELPWE
jgi:S-adenosylmethionine synthetase